MNLTKNFTLEELLASDYATRHDIKEQFNPAKKIIENLESLSENILQPLREEVGSIIISSGYRCDAVNKGIGGALLSQHSLGQAADIKYTHGNYWLFNKIIEMNLPFDQLIWEFGTDKEPEWVHVSYSDKNRKQVLKAKKNNGKSIYEPYKF